MRNLYKAGMISLMAVSLLWATESRLGVVSSGDADFLPNDERNIVLYPGNAKIFSNLATVEFGPLAQWNLGTFPHGILNVNNSNMAVVLRYNEPIWYFTHPRGGGWSDQLNEYGFIIASGTRRSAFGIGINLGYKRQGQGDTATYNSFSMLAVGINMGFTQKTSRSSIDFGFSIGYRYWKDDSFVVANSYYSSTNLPNLNLRFRFISGKKHQMLTAFTMGISRESYKKVVSSDSTEKYNIGTHIGTAVKFGSVSRFSRGLALGGVVFGLQYNYADSANKDLTINANIRMGGELKVSRYIGFMIGFVRPLFEYRRVYAGSHIRYTSTFEFFNGVTTGNIGMFLTLKNIRLDATINHALLYNGPYFITGTPSPLAGRISLKVKL